MNKLLTVISITLAVPSFVYMFENNLGVVLLVAGITLAAVLIGFYFESVVKNSGNDVLNRLVYFFTRNEKNYNIESKRFTYIYLPDNEYKLRKEIVIKSMSNSLQSIEDRFSWSAPATGAKIVPDNVRHEINKIWQQEKWTCYSIYFNECLSKRKVYETGASIENLFDVSGLAVPYIANTVSRKTKQLTMVVKIPQDLRVGDAQIKIYSTKNPAEAIYSEDIAYNETVKGYSKTFNFPRKGWRYVMSWEIRN